MNNQEIQQLIDELQSKALEQINIIDTLVAKRELLSPSDPYYSVYWVDLEHAKGLCRGILNTKAALKLMICNPEYY